MMVIPEKAGGQGEKGESSHKDCVIQSCLKGRIWGERETIKIQKAFNFYRNLYIYLLEVFLVRGVHAGGQIF